MLKKLFQDALHILLCRFEVFRLELLTRPTKAELLPSKPPGKNTVPIVLVAGFYGSARMLMPLKKYLEKAGFTVYAPPLTRNYARVPKLAEKLVEQIHAIPTKKVQLVTHSLGGVTALAALASDKATCNKTQQVITLGSPLQGCFWGTILINLRNRRWLKLNAQPNSKWMRQSGIAAKFRTLHATRDFVVWPSSHATIPGAKENTKLPVIGHMNLAFEKAAWDEVIQRLIK